MPEQTSWYKVTTPLLRVHRLSNINMYTYSGPMYITLCIIHNYPKAGRWMKSWCTCSTQQRNVSKLRLKDGSDLLHVIRGSGKKKDARRKGMYMLHVLVEVVHSGGVVGQLSRGNNKVWECQREVVNCWRLREKKRANKRQTEEPKNCKVKQGTAANFFFYLPFFPTYLSWFHPQILQKGVKHYISS